MVCMMGKYQKRALQQRQPAAGPVASVRVPLRGGCQTEGGCSVGRDQVSVPVGERAVRPGRRRGEQQRHPRFLLIVARGALGKGRVPAFDIEIGGVHVEQQVDRCDVQRGGARRAGVRGSIAGCLPRSTRI